jgi:hypothetical protein
VYSAACVLLSVLVCNSIETSVCSLWLWCTAPLHCLPLTGWVLLGLRYLIARVRSILQVSETHVLIIDCQCRNNSRPLANETNPLHVLFL